MRLRAEQLPFRSIGMLLLVVTTGCAGPIYQWEAQTRSTADAPISVLLNERVAVLSTLVSGPQAGYRQALTSAFDRAMVTASPETSIILSHEVTNLVNAKGLAKDYGELVAGYAQHGILERTRLGQLGSAIGVRYVFQPTLSSFQQEMSDRLVFFGWRIVQTRTSVLRLALQLWDTQTGAVVWASTGETTLASDVLGESRIPLDNAAEILWKAMIFDLRRNHTESTYTHLDQLFRNFASKPIEKESVPSQEVEPTKKSEGQP